VGDDHEPEVTLRDAVTIAVTIAIAVPGACCRTERERECQRCPSLDHPM
jgi:hypothetical protein